MTPLALFWCKSDADSMQATNGRKKYLTELKIKYVKFKNYAFIKI